MEHAAPLLQTVLSLAAVVAVILGLAWMARRLRGLREGLGDPALRVQATLAVGLKERVMLIEARGQSFLIGVAPGQVRLLSQLPPAPAPGLEDATVAEEGAAPAAEATPTFAAAFARQLQQVIGR